MAKASGGTRKVRPASGSVEYNRGVFDYETSMTDVVKVESYFSEKSGGYLLAMDGHNFDAIEREAFRRLADNGFLVVATPEGGKTFISGINDKGKATYSDGLAMGNVFELKSPSPQSNASDHLDNSIKKALNHARSKNAQVPVIYDRNGIYHRDYIERGLADYESKFSYEFKAILVIDKNGRVWEHQHNK